jgi:uroporphyrinogen III methyltransferase/synthase
LVEKLTIAGAIPVVSPAIEFCSPDDPQRAARAVREAASYAWIVFTSVHGVEAFFAGKPVELGSARFAAIGGKTALRLERAGANVDFMPEEAIEEALAAGLIERSAPGERILIFRAQEARQALPDLLRTARREVDDVAGYATRTVRDAAFAEAAFACDVWTFTSGSTVRALVANVPGASEIAATKIVACIGPVTADVARSLGLPVHAVAVAHDVDGLLAALACV